MLVNIRDHFLSCSSGRLVILFAPMQIKLQSYTSDFLIFLALCAGHVLSSCWCVMALSALLTCQRHFLLVSFLRRGCHHHFSHQETFFLVISSTCARWPIRQLRWPPLFYHPRRPPLALVVVVQIETLQSSPLGVEPVSDVGIVFVV